MFKFKDISDKDEDFNAQDHLLTPKSFFEKRRTTKKIYVFDLRSSEDFETSHLPGAQSLPFEHFEDSIYQMPFSGEIMLYGSDEKELFSAAEILYDNGFESFFIIDSYDSLIEGVEASFINISKKAQEHILDKLNSSAEKFQGISIIVEPKSDRKANYSIQFIELSNTPSENISINFGEFQVLVSKESIP